MMRRRSATATTPANVLAIGYPEELALAFGSRGYRDTPAS
jgi:hypothetical protein